jgi:GNAT superfamily N-acetyltransferase
MTSAPAVSTDLRRATEADVADVGRTIAEAFRDDPVTLWVHPPGDHPSVLVAWFTALTQAAVANGAVYVRGELEAVAVWFDATTPAPPPRAEPDAAMRALCGPYADSFLRLEHATHAIHPQEPPHHYLGFLAVRDHLRGRGLGGQLLDAHHAALDAQGLPAYLEASSEASRRLYLRHGYTELNGPVFLPGGPPVWPMWRPPGQGSGTAV